MTGRAHKVAGPRQARASLTERREPAPLRLMNYSLGVVLLLVVTSACGDDGASSTDGPGGGGNGGNGNGAGSSSSDGGSTNSAGGTLEAGGNPSGGAPTTGNSMADPYAAERQICIDKINELRATKSLPPLAAWVDGQTCADGQATSDESSGSPHGAFGTCRESGQNECLGAGAQLGAEGPFR